MIDKSYRELIMEFGFYCEWYFKLREDFEWRKYMIGFVILRIYFGF